MKMHISALLLLVMLFTSVSCRKENGEGPVISRSYNLYGFSSVNSGIDADVYVTQGTTYQVEVEAQQNILDMIENQVSGGELRLGFKRNSRIGRHKPITVHITAPVLDGLRIAGSGSVHALQPLSAAGMELEISGSGSIYLSHFSGQSLSAHISGSGHISVAGDGIQTETLENSGSGDMDMLNLAAGTVSVHISGTGSVAVTAAASLYASISGSGEITYDGTPKVSSSISGLGHIRHI